MTPKGKAEDLHDKFMDEVCGLNELHEHHKASKQCALICVDEIINNQFDFTYDGFLNYWQEVKVEIEKL